MKLTNKELVENYNMLNHMMAQEEKSGSNIFADHVRVSRIVESNIRKMGKALEPYDQERMELINMCYTKADPENGTEAALIPDMKDDWENGITALLDKETEVDLKTFTVSDLDGLFLKMSHQKALFYMIEDE